MNLYSVTLLMGCELLNNLGNIWIFYVCVNFGMLENAFSLLKGLAMVALTIPLFLDISYILLQTVNPSQMIPLLEDKLNKLAYIDGVTSIKQWHYMCLDKSHRVCTLKVNTREDADTEEIKR